MRKILTARLPVGAFGESIYRVATANALFMQPPVEITNDVTPSGKGQVK
jgi:hypothetical protein